MAASVKIILETERLILREWLPEDATPFAKMNSDPAVMEYFPKKLSMSETEAMILKLQDEQSRNGMTFWATELKSTGEFIGFVGIRRFDDSLPFGPGTEIGWRLKKSVWGIGLATEGALACLNYGFTRFRIDEIVAFTAIQNTRSMRVMEKIGMKRDPHGDFDHPRVPDGHPVKRHVLYRVRGNS